MLRCYKIIVFLFICIGLSSCQDEFDFEAMHNMNSETLYQATFSSIYGEIDPNQNWDFSYGSSNEITRADNISVEAVNGLEFDIVNNTIQNNDDKNYELYSKITSALSEGVSKNGTTTVLTTPGNPFTIMPVTAQGAYMYDLYVKIGDQNPQLVFTKNWTDWSQAYCHGMSINSTCYNISHTECGICKGSGLVSNTCSTCNGTGKSSTKCSYCKGNYIIEQTTKDCDDCHGTGKITTTTTSTCTKCQGKGYYKSGSFYYGCSNCGGSGWGYSKGSTNIKKGLGTVTTTTTTNCNTCSSTGKIILSQTICEHCIEGYVPCSNCNGSGTVHGVCSNCKGTGSIASILSQATGIQTINMPGIKVNCDPSSVGTVIQIFIRIIQSGDNGTPAGTILGSTTGNTFFVSLTNDPKPTELSDDDSGISDIDQILCENSEIKFLGIEDRSLTDSGCDKDYNDLTIAIIGDDKAIQSLDLTNNQYKSTSTISKRYMVEDMGYTEPSSYAVENNITDIDFNDIVVDLLQDVKTVGQIEKTNGIITKQTSTNTVDNTTAVIRALGGTWDFKLCIGDVPVFQKNLAIKNQSNPTYPLIFNDNYTISTHGSSSSTQVTQLYSYIMYNTSAFVSSNADGNFNYDNWIVKISSNDNSAINNWVPKDNNISFILIDNVDSQDFTSDTVIEDDYEEDNFVVKFPEKGATPKIIAFPITKKWQRERSHVNNAWFSSSNSVN